MASLKKSGTIYYAQYYVGMQQKRVCLDTSSLQVAKEKIRQLESAMVRGEDNPRRNRNDGQSSRRILCGNRS